MLDTFVYWQGIVGGDWGIRRAAGLFKGVVGAVLVFGANKVAHASASRGSTSETWNSRHAADRVAGRRGRRPSWMEKPHPLVRAAKGVALAVLRPVGDHPVLVHRGHLAG